MNINERIKHVRKSLDLNQGEFGKRIKLKQGAISKMEQDGSTVTDQNIRMICETFNVAERWLRTGEGPMQRETRDALLSKLAEQYSLTPDGVAIIRAVLGLSPEQREAAVAIVRRIAAQLTPAEEEDTRSAIDREVDAYRQELEAQDKEPSLFDGTNGIKEA